MNESAILLIPVRKEITGTASFEKSDKVRNKGPLNTVDAVVEDIIAELPLEANVSTAKLEEDELRVLELTLGKYVRYKLDNLSAGVNQKLKEDCLTKAGDSNLDDVDVVLR